MAGMNACAIWNAPIVTSSSLHCRKVLSILGVRELFNLLVFAQKLKENCEQAAPYLRFDTICQVLCESHYRATQGSMSDGRGWKAWPEMVLLGLMRESQKRVGSECTEADAARIVEKLVAPMIGEEDEMFRADKKNVKKGKSSSSSPLESEQESLIIASTQVPSPAEAVPLPAPLPIAEQAVQPDALATATGTAAPMAMPMAMPVTMPVAMPADDPGLQA